MFDLAVDGETPAREMVYFAAAKDIAWPDPGLRATLRGDGDGLVLELVADRLARAAWIDFGTLDADLSDNAITLLPGEPVSVRLTSQAGVDALRDALQARTLADATPLPSESSTRPATP
ncbi:glycoside hydrolase family 2 protein [Luteimonas saliphila]|uniref:glycoside hydrolase family 2 protein n=1 Tax=Luteimonas saliphila TaxID=2804919 RepID=UPI00307FDB47